MKTLMLLFLMGVQFGLSAQEHIPKDAPYLGTWEYDGNNDDAPRIFDNLPQYELFFAAGEEYSYISFPAHDELGYPQPHYFIAEIKGDSISGHTSHWPGGKPLEGEDFSFQFTYKLAKIDVFSIKWKGKWYRYRRR